nr:hypothetical protein [Streptomyces guryensis]
MRCGLPVVSTDCPHEPGEIIRHGVDGCPVPRDGTLGVADALPALIRDDGRRAEMGRAARAGAAGRAAPPPPGPADWRDRATVLAATAGILARAAVRRGRREPGRVG